MRRWLKNRWLLVYLFIALSGCSPVTTITVVQHAEMAMASFPAENARCQEYAEKVAMGADAGWSWRIGIYELQNAEASREVQQWRCLTSRGWHPVLQVIGPTRSSAGDFRHALSDCLAGTLLGRMVPERLTGVALLAIMERMQATSDVFGAGTAALSCLRQRQWRIVRDAGFLVPGRDAVAHSVILPPTGEEVFRKFTDDGSRLIRDAGQGIHWRKVQMHQRMAVGRSALVVEQIDVANRGSYADAVAYVASLNRSNADGHHDWRLPWIDEAQSLANYLAGTGLNLLTAQPLNLTGLIWTSEQAADGTPLAVDIASSAVVPLGCDGMYCALILPVAGHGWHGTKNLAGGP